MFKNKFSYFPLIYPPLQKMKNQKAHLGQLSDKIKLIQFFGTPSEGKIGCKQLQHTFLDQWNTFCFKNFAQQITVELRSDPKK